MIYFFMTFRYLSNAEEADVARNVGMLIVMWFESIWMEVKWTSELSLVPTEQLVAEVRKKRQVWAKGFAEI